VGCSDSPFSLVLLTGKTRCARTCEKGRKPPEAEDGENEATTRQSPPLAEAGLERRENVSIKKNGGGGGNRMRQRRTSPLRAQLYSPPMDSPRKTLRAQPAFHLRPAQAHKRPPPPVFLAKPHFPPSTAANAAPQGRASRWQEAGSRPTAHARLGGPVCLRRGSETPPYRRPRPRLSLFISRRSAALSSCA